VLQHPFRDRSLLSGGLKRADGKPIASGTNSVDISSAFLC
jgi:hypothetical protein